MKNEEKTCLYCGEKPVSIEMRCTHPTQGASHGVSLKTCVGCFNKRPVEKQLTCPMCEKVAAIFVDVVQAYHGDRFKAMLWAKVGYVVELPFEAGQHQSFVQYNMSGSYHLDYDHVMLPDGKRVLIIDFGASRGTGVVENFMYDYAPPTLRVMPLDTPADFAFLSRTQ